MTFLGLAIRWAISFITNGELVASACINTSNSSETIVRVINLVEDFVVAITVVVVAVPEGLPLAVTLSLSLSMFKMMRDKCFVRHLDAAETMGQATTICTDKTGTLTYNRMQVVRFMIKGHIFKGEGSGDKDAQPFSPTTLPLEVNRLITECCSMNSNSFIKNEDQADEPGFFPVFVGSATEGAMLILSKKLGVKYQKLRKEIQIAPNGVWSFSAERKRMSTLCVLPESRKYRLYTKGASEIVLDLCTMIYDPTSMRAVLIKPSDVEEISKNIKAWATEGLRTISIAYKDFDHHVDNSVEDPETDLVFVCILAIKDPLRKEIPQAVASCKKAGIVVRMVTGDNILTATKIAKEANIFFGDGIALEGPVFRAMPKPEKLDILDRLQVFLV